MFCFIRCDFHRTHRLINRRIVENHAFKQNYPPNPQQIPSNPVDCFFTKSTRFFEILFANASHSLIIEVERLNKNCLKIKGGFYHGLQNN